MDFDMPGTLFICHPNRYRVNLWMGRTDIYSLGIMLYEMLAGQRPFSENNLGKLMDFHLKEDAPDPRI
ncbi:MAG: hypothetical protein WA126_11595 [Thermodesulfovibrionales bacterium]